MTGLVILLVLIGQQTYEMEEIVVTATRYPLILRDVAVTTMIIEEDEINNLCPLEIGEVINAASGIEFKDYGTPGAIASVFIRGIPSNGTLVLLNGHPLNFVTNSMADLSFINLHAIKRIEIVKGPVSTLYGNNALGGVVNIITTQKSAKPEVLLKFIPSTTSFDTLLQSKTITLETALPLGASQFSLSGAYRTSVGFRSNSDLEQYNLQSSFEYHTKALRSTAHIAYSDKEYGVPGPMPIIDSIHTIPIFGDLSATSLYDREHDRIILGDINLQWNIFDYVTWHNTIYADRKLMQYHTKYSGWMGDTIIEDNDYLIHTVGFTTMLLSQFRDIDIIAGIDANYDTLETTRISEQSGDTTWNAGSYTVGGWLEIKKNFIDILTVAPSLRFDRNQEYGNFFSPAIGIIGILKSNLWLKSSIGKTYKAPTFNDLYWPNAGNSNLKPEHGWAYEIRLESTPVSRLFCAASFFMRNIEDRIFWLPDTSGLWYPQNVNYLSVIGCDTELQNKIVDCVDFAFDMTYLIAKQKNDEIIYDYYDWMADTGLTIIQEIERDAAFVPQFSVSSKINVHLPYNFNLHTSGYYLAERYNYYTNHTDSPNITMDKKILDCYLLLNSAISRVFMKYLTISIGVKNMLDTEYATQFGSFDDLDYPMPGRTIFAQLIVDY